MFGSCFERECSLAGTLSFQGIVFYADGEFDRKLAVLACKAGVKAILHSLPGRNDTVRLGLEALLSALPGLAGCIFLPGDQPLLRKESLEAMARDFSALDEKERAILRLGFRA